LVLNKRTLLIALGVLWIVILSYNFGLFGGSDGSLEGGGKLRRAKQVAAAKDFPILNTKKLVRKPPPFKKVRKDIFTPFGYGRSASKTAVTAVAAPEMAYASPLEKLISELSFIGFVENAREKTIFLGRGEDVLLVKKGVSIAGLVRVIDITERQLILGDIYGASDRRFEISLE
jgi:hypothetical protein